MKAQDIAFLKRFEEATLEDKDFDHLGHLKMGFLCLQKYDQEQATQVACNGIKSLAQKFDVPDKYHHTLTIAMMKVLAHRMTEIEGFEAFVTKNHDLVDGALDILLEHYSADMLWSDKARTSWIEPNLKPFG